MPHVTLVLCIFFCSEAINRHKGFARSFITLLTSGVVVSFFSGVVEGEMASKSLIIVMGVLLAALLLLSSEVAARELAENAKEVQTKGAVDGDGYGGGHHGGYPGRGNPGRGYPGKGYPGHGPRCRYGCCGHGYHGGCKCCTYEGEVPDFTADAKPHN